MPAKYEQQQAYSKPLGEIETRILEAMKEPDYPYQLHWIAKKIYNSNMDSQKRLDLTFKSLKKLINKKIVQKVSRGWYRRRLLITDSEILQREDMQNRLDRIERKIDAIYQIVRD